MTESQQTRAFLKAWRDHYPLGLAVKLNDRSTVGLSDAVLMIAGATTWVEFKREGESLRPSQAAFHHKLRLAGICTAVVWFHPRREVTIQVGSLPPRRLSWRFVIACWAAIVA